MKRGDSMNIELYNYSGENNVVDKSALLTDSTAKTGTLRGECNVLNPVVFVEGTPDSRNYMYIQEFGRYYFITEQTAVRTGVYRITGRVDVLHTYRTQIKACTAIAARAAKPECQNAYLPDEMRRAYSPQTVCVRSLDVAPSMPFSYGAAPRYVLVTAG